MWSIAQVATAEFYEFMEFSDRGGHGQSSKCRGGTTYHISRQPLHKNGQNEQNTGIKIVGNRLRKIVDFNSPARAGDDVSRYLQCMHGLHGPPHSAQSSVCCCHHVCSRHHFSSPSPAWLYSGSIVALSWLYRGPPVAL